ncbi:MAG: hypothetical protein WCE68_17825 [Anaerolineales bacterium]
MLASLLIWIYIIVFSYLYGATILEMLQKFFDIQPDEQISSKPLIALFGLCCITVLACLLSLFIKLGWLAQTIFLIGGIILGLRLRRTQARSFQIKLNSISWLLILLSLLILLTTLENGSHSPINPDTGIYHAQAIRWIETYPAVPGLGNLHSRLAYDSSWLVINAFFSFSFLGLRSFHVVPGAFLILVLIYLVGGTDRLLKGNITITDILKTLLIPLIFYTFVSEISSPGTDFPADVFIWVILALWLESIEINPTDGNKPIKVDELLIFTFTIFLITVKLSIIAVILLPLFIVVNQARKRAVNALKLMAVALIILGPWLARNLILSGYWVYPVPFLANLSPNWDWKIPLPNVTQEARMIQAWARIPNLNRDIVLAMPLQKWLKEWSERLTEIQKLFVLGAVFSPLVFGLAWLTGLHKKIFKGYFAYIYLVSCIGLIFWLYEAPDIRFGYGFIISSILLAITPCLVWLLHKMPYQKNLVFGMVILLILFQARILYKTNSISTLASRIILPADYNSSLATAPCSIHGYTLFCAEYYNECDYSPFPCIPPGDTRKNIELRGDSLEDGFRYIEKP